MIVREIKTMQGWHEFAEQSGMSSFDDYCKPGDLVDEGVFDHFLNVLPPHRWTKDFLQVGESYDSAFNPYKGKWQPTFPTFQRRGKSDYMYLGNCFTDEEWDQEVFNTKTVSDFLKVTCRVYKVGGVEMQDTRPRIVCKDGFSISVQGGEALYSRPRKNLRDGAYKEVECGFPSQKEELLMKYAEDTSKPTETVYAYVPVSVVEQVLEKHGGMFYRKAGWA